ncbi:hypothetical protein GOBAR_AA20702 [Gossypium barbadense]|uniref:Myb/SANT-like domain-containing protein n=1 Tax=Gossypium barbadense TaxID=3634 RepID=A0A2P5X9F5_GOSBA|nr:hypothetical protein GOBAR_AA20702 [Gossypium barbadense]
MSTSVVEVSGEKVKAMWDKRLTEIFCDICFKEILKGNRPSVPKAQKFRTSSIDPEFEGKLDQMFMGIVATGDKAWAPSSGTLCGDFFEDVNNEIPEENEEENVRNDIYILNDVQISNDHISNDVHIDGNGQKRKTPEISSSHFKIGRKKSSKQIGGAARLSSQIEKLCNVADNISQATSSLTPVMDPYGIPQAFKVLDSMSEEVPEASQIYSQVMSIVENSNGDERDDEREKKEILQRMECFNRLFVVASSSVQLYYEKYILKQPCMDSKQSGETWI